MTPRKRRRPNPFKALASTILYGLAFLVVLYLSAPVIQEWLLSTLGAFSSDPHKHYPLLFMPAAERPLWHWVLSFIAGCVLFRWIRRWLR